MKIIKKQFAVHKVKPDGTRVNYYLQPAYEIHYNKIPPNVTQKWHFHEKIEETILVLKGFMEVRWIENDIEKKEIIRQGDLIRVENNLHTFSNVSDNFVSFIVVKLILDGKDYSKIFKNDKILPK